MKKIVLAALLLLSTGSQAQLSGLLKKVAGGKSDKNASEANKIDQKNPFDGNRYWENGHPSYVSNSGTQSEFHQSNVEKIVFTK